MTPTEASHILSRITIEWPHTVIPDEAFPVWFHYLKDFTVEEVGNALTKYALARNKFAPTPGELASLTMEPHQEIVPFRDGRKLLQSSKFYPYHLRSGDGIHNTLGALEFWSEKGVPELLLRLVQSHGVFDVLHGPENGYQAIGEGKAADARDMRRDYEQRIIPEYRKDPTQGLALSRARKIAGVGPGGKKKSGLAKPNFVAEIESGEGGGWDEDAKRAVAEDRERMKAEVARKRMLRQAEEAARRLAQEASDKEVAAVAQALTGDPSAPRTPSPSSTLPTAPSAPHKELEAPDPRNLDF